MSSYESISRQDDLFGDIGQVREVAVTLSKDRVTQTVKAPRLQVTCPEDVAGIFHPYFEDLATEHFMVVVLNTANVVTDYAVASQGGLAASIVEPRAIFQAALLCNAAAIIVLHNHPSGNPEPSREDIKVTRQLVEAGKLLGIPVHDHIIMTPDGGHTSLAERNLLQ